MSKHKRVRIYYIESLPGDQKYGAWNGVVTGRTKYGTWYVRLDDGREYEVYPDECEVLK